MVLEPWKKKKKKRREPSPELRRALPEILEILEIILEIDPGTQDLLSTRGVGTGTEVHQAEGEDPPHREETPGHPTKHRSA